MEFQSIPLLAYNPLDPIVAMLHVVLAALASVLHNYGWSLVALAAIVKIIFWPLNTMQFKAMLKTQALSPQIKALQQRYKGDKEKLNAETMKLYKESGANPLAGCFPLLLQMPILFSLYWAIIVDKDTVFAKSTWLWIGTPFSFHSPYHILAPNLAETDYILLALYIISMYFSIRFTSPAMDEQQAQQQRIMSFISPAMIGYLSIQYHWASALLLYWLSFNVFTMAQQLYLINKYHRNPAPIGPHPERAALATGTDAKIADGAAASDGNPGNGTPSARSKRKRRSKR